MQKDKDLTDLIVDSQTLTNAVQGLSKFIWDNFFSTEVQLEDINALAGLTTSILALAEKNTDELTAYESTIENQVKQAS